MNITTTNLADFGSRERNELTDILIAWREHGLPDDFYQDEIIPMMNKNSGDVFLTNSDYQVAMLSGDRLESFYSCPECGCEGFRDEMTVNDCCVEYMNELFPVEEQPE